MRSLVISSRLAFAAEETAQGQGGEIDALERAAAIGPIVVVDHLQKAIEREAFDRRADPLASLRISNAPLEQLDCIALAFRVRRFAVLHTISRILQPPNFVALENAAHTTGFHTIDLSVRGFKNSSNACVTKACTLMLSRTARNLRR